MFESLAAATTSFICYNLSTPGTSFNHLKSTNATSAQPFRYPVLALSTAHTMSLPYAADAETSLSPSELQVLKSQYETELAAGHVTTQTKFNYAWGLVKSKQRAEMSIGVGLLTEIYRADPPRRRECLYYLSLGHYKMGNYDEARRFNGECRAQI